MDTYTYTARSANDPEKVITFTMTDEYLEISMTGMLEDISEIVSGEEGKEAIEEKIKTQAKPAALKVMEEVSGPIHISDVNGEVKETDQLRLTIWKRLGGLRAAPVIFQFERVDNPEAAQAFISELNERKAAAEHPGKFFGPLDYWLGWIGLAVGLVLLWRWTRRD